jgi:hypothetical protein
MTARKSILTRSHIHRDGKCFTQRTYKRGNFASREPNYLKVYSDGSSREIRGEDTINVVLNPKCRAKKGAK